MPPVGLALTTGCAACHDHKFDPVSTKDFYALTAFFRNNTMAAMDGNVSDPAPVLFVPAAADRARWPGLQAEIGAAESALQARAAQADADFEAWLASARTLAPLPVDRRVRLHAALDEAAGPIVLAGVAVSGAAAVSRIDGVYGPAPEIN